MDLVKTDPTQASYQVMEKVIAQGDLSALTAKERVELYTRICESLNLNPLTRPFQYIKFDGKLTLYASKDCTEQLRHLHGISIIKIEKEVIDGVFLYTAWARSANGQEDVATGAVTIKGLQGKALANAFKISETQAKRRVTLSICGLGLTDESEIQDIPTAQKVNVDFETGEVVAEVVEKPIDHNALKEEIELATTLNNLKEAYSKAYVAYKGNLDAMKDLTELKDQRKITLDSLLMGEATNEPV